MTADRLLLSDGSNLLLSDGASVLLLSTETDDSSSSSPCRRFYNLASASTFALSSRGSFDLTSVATYRSR